MKDAYVEGRGPAPGGGLFREDLYYRLAVAEDIQIPPLRDRREDIPLFVFHFWTLWMKKDDGDQSLKSTLKCFNADAMAQLVTMRWSGNVRELENFLLNRLFPRLPKGCVEISRDDVESAKIY